MSNTTLPYEEVAAETFPKPADNGGVITASGLFEQIKHILSPRPLRRPRRTRLSKDQERRDVAAAREAQLEPGSVSLDDLRRELGL